ncbi:hypothetical protein [Piscinibacter sp. XHJ-5]|uniref:hypothetical protein n=1 Tax=Piscinibacter sp. XHJ-5 TaxID=3037797 RepID=UPI002453084D|nr:hypothetical protein [Piscinibacter sp. XHJ-5]
MKRICLAVAMAAATLPAWSTTNVGVSVEVGQPGFYGRIDVGNVSAPPPVLVYPQPVVIAPTPVAVRQQPIYMHVPPGHAKNWAKHCGKYNACGQPVYFVQENWYQQQYVPAYAHEHGKKEKHGKGGHGHGKGHGKGKDD